MTPFFILRRRFTFLIEWMLVERVRGVSVSNVPRNEMVVIKRSCLVLMDIQEVLCSGIKQTNIPVQI